MSFEQIVIYGLATIGFGGTFMAIGAGYGFFKGIQYALTHPRQVRQALDDVYATDHMSLRQFLRYRQAKRERGEES